MARDFTSAAAAATVSTGFLSGSAGPFTVSCYFRPSGSYPWGVSSNRNILRAEPSGQWRVRWRASANTVDFAATGYTGSDPGTSSGITLLESHGATGAWVGYRYAGASGEWAKFLDGVKTVINASITFSFGAATSFAVGYSSPNFVQGVIAEVAIWNVALTDAQMQILATGVAADHVGNDSDLLVYWPLRGTNDPEPDYTIFPAASGGNALDPGDAPFATHPRIISRDENIQYAPAWVLDIPYGDRTIRAASVDLQTPTDVDILGVPYPGRIKNGAQITVREALSDNTYGIQQPGLVTVTLDNSEMLPPPEIDDCVLWLHPQTLTAMPGGKVPTWVDSSGAGNDATQAVAGERPKRTEHNAASYLSMTAATQGLTTPLTVTSGDATFMVVYARGSAFPVLQCALQGGSAWYMGPAGGVHRLHDGVGFIDGPTVVDGEYVVSTAIISGTTISFYVNGNLIGTRSNPNYPNAIGLGAEGFYTTLGLVGFIAGAAVWKRALTEDQRRRAELTLASGHGVSLGLEDEIVTPFRSWRNVPAILRRYDRDSHELVTVLRGTIKGAQFPLDSTGQRAALTIGSQADAVLSTMIPTEVIDVDRFPTASDLRAPIPVVFGTAYLSPPYIARDDTSDPGGRIFAVSRTDDRDTSTMHVVIRDAFYDAEPGAPGLERATDWYDAPGSPAYYSSTQFSVTGDQRYLYHAASFGGMPIRFKTTASGSTYLYAHITAYDTGTNRVTVEGGELGVGLSNVQILGEYMVDLGSILMPSGEIVLGVRFIAGGEQGGVVVQAENRTYSNPSDIIAEILGNSAWGLGESIDTTTFAEAVTAFADAGLDVVNGTIGGNRQQRPARDVLNELLALRGCRLVKNAESGKWELYVDRPSADPVLTLGLGDGQWNNVKEVVSYGGKSLEETVKTLTLHYGPKHRLKSNQDADRLVAADTDFAIHAEVHPHGQTRVLASPWLTEHDTAIEVLNYRARRMRVEDTTLVLRAGMAARFLAVGEVVDVRVPRLGIGQRMRVAEIGRGLAEHTLALVPYDASIFSAATSADVYYDDSTSPTSGDGGANTSADTRDLDERRSRITAGGNPVRNSDFAIPLRHEFADLASNSLPGWIIQSPSDFSAFSITEDSELFGAAYLSATLTSVSSSSYLHTANFAGSQDVTTAISPGEVLLVSVYADSTEGWHMQVVWIDGVSPVLVEPVLRVAPNDTNGKDWQRCYAVTRAPADTMYAILRIKFDATGTYKFDAVKAEIASNLTSRPTPYVREAYWGVDPLALLPGALRIRPDGEAEHGTVIAHKTVTLSSLSGAVEDTASNFIEAGMSIFTLTARVTTAVTGCTSINIGTPASPTLFITGMGVSAGTTDNALEGSYTAWLTSNADVAVRVTAVGGGASFTGGDIVLTLHYGKATPPTS